MTRAHRRVRPQSDADVPRRRPPPPPPVNSNSVDSFFLPSFLPSYVSCPMVRVRMMTDFHRNLRRGLQARVRQPDPEDCVSLFPASAIFSFPLDWNSRHAALKKSLIGDPSGPDSIISYAHGGSATRFPGTQLISGSRHHRFQQKELWMQNVFIV